MKVTYWRLASVLLVVGLVNPPGFAQVVFSETFDGNQAGWTLDADWQIGPATASSAPEYGFPDPAFDGNGVVGGGVAGVVIGGNAPTAVHPYYYLTSPVIPLTGTIAARLRFDRWLNTDWAPYMQNVVEAWDGANWILIWQTLGGPTITDHAWTTVELDIVLYTGPGFRFRIGYAVGSPFVYHVSSWNVDNVQVVADCFTGFTYLNSTGTLGFHVVNCTPSVTVVSAFTLSQNGFPNGWFYGLGIPVFDLIAQVSTGSPPFVMATDANGDAFFQVSGVPLYLTIYGVSVFLNPATGLPASSDEPFMLTTY
jgi:hypothetical protein